MVGIGLHRVRGGPGYRRTCRLCVLVPQTQMPQASVSPGALAMVWGPAEPALLWLPSLSPFSHLPPPSPGCGLRSPASSLLPSLHFRFTLAGAGRSGSGCELISSSPWQGCGCGAGRRGHPFLLCPCFPTVPRAQDAGTPGCLSLECSLCLPLQQGRRMWGAHSATLHPRAQRSGWVEEVLRRWQLGGKLALCSLLALLGPGAGPCGPRRGPHLGAVPLDTL